MGVEVRKLKKPPRKPAVDNYFSVHTHSEFSHLDGMGTVTELVKKTAEMGQPGLALTDHGSMAGCIRLYKECKKHDIAPFPGSEFYLVESVIDEEARKKRYHIGLLALTEKGYKALVRLSSFSHRRDRYHYKPLIDWSDLEALSEHAKNDIALTTGCYFGWVIQNHLAMGRDCNRTAMLVKRLNKLFPNTYVELQHHDIDVHEHEGKAVSEEELIGDLVYIAQGLGLPIVAGQDAHYCSVKDQSAHNMMKRIGYFTEADDVIFPGGPYHHASSDFVLDRYSVPVVDLIQDGHADLLNMNRLKIPAFDTYRFHVPTVSRFADQRLRKMCNRALEMRPDLEMQDHYHKRVAKELKVIEKMKMANYFIIVEDIISWCKKNGIITNARGSVNGSLVTFLLGISEVDPLLWDTDFDRFLDLERMKPPDVDIDVESSQRHLLLDYARSKFPTAVQIGTYSRLGMSEEIDESTGDVVDKGSVWVQYHAARRRQDKSYNPETARIPADDRRQLVRLSHLRPRKAPGVHAAGFVLPGDDLPIEDYLPTMLIVSSESTVTQSVMEDVEDAGFVKLDFLGVSALGTMNQCIQTLGKPLNDFHWIPYDDKRTCSLLSSGRTEGVFQFDGYSTSMGGREMQIRSTYDVILCMALYRPALMQGGQKDKFLALRAAGKSETIHPMFDTFLKDTFGVPVFQEQVMRMMRAAGLSVLQWNDVMKAVKASNDKIENALKVFDETRPIFIRGAIERGCTKKQAELAWKTVMEFTDYGFNKAHAASYGIMAYRSGYLLAHHPLAYYEALLRTWAGNKKETRYRQAARRAKIRFIRPDVNFSDTLWSIDTSQPNAIRQGLLSIGGVGEKSADAIVSERKNNGPFTSVEDLISRVPGRQMSGGKDYLKSGVANGTLKHLQDANALRSITGDE